MSVHPARINRLSHFVSDLFLTPIPGLSNVSFISRITGTDALKKLRESSKKVLGGSIMADEMEKIDVDLDIMADADLRDKHDRDIQAKMFDKPVYSKEHRGQRITNTTDELRPILDAFWELEKMKDKIRCELRPPMEDNIRLAIELSKRSPDVIPKPLEELFDRLQRQRLAVLALRNQMMKQRVIAYEMVVELQKKGEVEQVPDAQLIAQQRTQSLTEVTKFLSQHTIEEGELERRIQEKMDKLEVNQKKTDVLRERMNAKEEKQVKKMHRRAFAGAIGSVFVGAVMIHGAEVKQENIRNSPYKDFAVPYTRVMQSPQEFTPSLTWRFDDPLSNKRVEVKAHSAEHASPQMLWHGEMTARLLDQSYTVASGNPNPPVDRSSAMLHPMKDDLAVTQWFSSLFTVSPRPKAVEEMLTSTKEFHVFNDSTVASYSLAPGSRQAKMERDFMLGITCPVAIPSGNPHESGEVIPDNAQHIGELSHFPRYAMQIGETDQMAGVVNYKGKISYKAALGTHPGAFVLMPIPVHLEKNFSDMEEIYDPKTKKLLNPNIDPAKKKMAGEDMDGTSMASPEFAGKIAAIKTMYPQLSWDNIMYAVALGSRKDFMGAPGGFNEDQVRSFCKFTAESTLVSEAKRKELCEVVSDILKAELKEPITLSNIINKKEEFRSALAAHYPHATDNLQAMLDEVENRMGPANYTYERMKNRFVTKHYDPLIEFTKVADSDLTYNSLVGYGTPNFELTQIILENMLYQRILHPEIIDNPRAIVRDVMDSGAPKTEHRIVIPADKDIFKLVLDIVPTDTSKDATVTLTDEQDNKVVINVVKGVPVSRHTDVGHMAKHGGTLTVTSSDPFRLGSVVQDNNRDAITLGVTKLSELKSLEELKKLIDPAALAALPVAMPKAPIVVNEVNRGRQ